MALDELRELARLEFGEKRVRLDPLLLLYRVKE